MSEETDHDHYSNHIFAELNRLLMFWNEWRAMVADREAVQLLNTHASGFFFLVNEAFLQAIYLGVSRLTDPASGRGKGKGNVSLKTLLGDPRLIQQPELHADLKHLIEGVEDAAKPVQAWRNKWFAHRDRAAVLDPDRLPEVQAEALGEVIGLLREVHGIYGTRVRDVHFDHDVWIPNGMEALLASLRSAPTRLDRLMEEEERDLARGKLGDPS